MLFSTNLFVVLIYQTDTDNRDIYVITEEQAGASSSNFFTRSKQDYEAAVASLQYPKGFDDLEGRLQYFTSFASIYGRMTWLWF